jgi:hypothetical protein
MAEPEPHYHAHTRTLPVRGDLKLPTALSLLVATLMALASLAGWLSPSTLYPTEEAIQSFVANDIVNLVLGLPILLGSMAAARRGRLIGLLFWPGGLLYAFYNYLAYLVGVPMAWPWLLYLPLVLLSLIALILLVSRLDGGALRARLHGALHERFAGGALVLFGVFVVLRDLGVLVSAQTDATVNLALELPVIVADFALSIAWIVVGVQLWRQRALGYELGAGMLFQGSMLFVGVIVYFLLQPALAGTPLAVADIAVLAVMSLVCILPLALVARGIVQRDRI